MIDTPPVLQYDDTISMVNDKGLEYNELCASLKALHEKYLARRGELCQILRETAVLKQKALKILAKSNRITGRLTAYQRQMTGINYSLAEIKTRIRQISANQIQENILPPVLTPLPQTLTLPGDFSKEDGRSLLDLKKKGTMVLSMIDDLRKKILAIDLLELRCRELILAINKALEAFRHESRIIHGKIYPYGVFSMCRRSLRSLFGTGYFSFRDMKELNALGNITSSVLKIADCPVA